MSGFVHVKEATLVTPTAPTPSHTLKLSALDSQQFVRFTFEYLLVFKPLSGLDKTATAARLKSALGQALVPYYPLAGRVRARPDGSGLEVLCRAQGAAFIEAVSGYKIAEFEKAPRWSTEWQELLSLRVADVLKGAPPLVIQLTWLSDGGATLAAGFNHCLCDGIGGAEFLNSLNELSCSHEFRLTELKRKPVWRRHLLDSERFRRTQLNPVSDHPEFKCVPDVCGFSTRFIREVLVPTSIIFDKKMLNKLKLMASSTSQLSEFSCTSFEVLSAHVWSSWAKALNLPSNQIVKLVFSINIRNRVKPSLPSGYYGNAFVLGCAQITVKDLTQKGLGHATELVKRAKERVDDEFVREVVESVSSTQASVDSTGVLIMTQWSRLGLERVDFGMGRPVHVGPVCCDKYCILSPVGDRTDAFKVNVAVPASAVDQYLHLLRSVCS